MNKLVLNIIFLILSKFKEKFGNILIGNFSNKSASTLDKSLEFTNTQVFFNFIIKETKLQRILVFPFPALPFNNTSLSVARTTFLKIFSN